MKKYAFIAIASVAFLTSCNDTKKEAVVEEPATTTTPAPADAEDHTGHNHGPEGHTAAQGANPEHGQPGHRCDIPVGAPLDSPVASQPNASAMPSAPAQAQQPFLVNDGAKAAGSNATAGKLNPEHGQPGHRCDIAVGQPLS